MTGTLLYIIFIGSSQVNNKLEELIRMIKESRSSIPARNIEEFIIVFKYLAFVACAAQAPIAERLLDETLDLVDKAGLAEKPM